MYKITPNLESFDQMERAQSQYLAEIPAKIAQLSDGFKCQSNPNIKY